MYFWGGFQKDFRKDFAIIKSKVNKLNEISFESVDISNVDIKEKSIIVLCGNDSRSKSRAEYYAKLCRNWLQGSKQNHKISTYSIYYPDKQPLFNESPMMELDYDGLARELFHDVLFNGRYPVCADQVKENLKNVLFLGHSAGGYVMNKLMKSFLDILKELNYSPKDRTSICSQIVFMGYSPYRIVTSAPIKAVYIAPLFDSMGSTKMIYNILKRRKNVISSVQERDIFGRDKLNTRVKERFVRDYKELIGEDNAVCFMNNRSLIFTPDLLFSDGQKEDHNFTGAVNYEVKNPYQTEAGELTARFISEILDYCVSTPREQFDVFDLYNQTLKLNKETRMKL